MAFKPHAADGHRALSVMTREKAREDSAAPDIEIQMIAHGYARAQKGYMAMAVVPSVQKVLDKAGISINDVKVIKTSNFVTINDIYLADQMGVDVNGSALIFGHSRAPTAGGLITPFSS